MVYGECKTRYFRGIVHLFYTQNNWVIVGWGNFSKKFWAQLIAQMLIEQAVFDEKVVVSRWERENRNEIAIIQLEISSGFFFSLRTSTRNL